MIFVFIFFGKGCLVSKKTVLRTIVVSVLILRFNSSAMVQQLDLSNLPFIGNSELAQINTQSLMDGNVNEILKD